MSTLLLAPLMLLAAPAQAAPDVDPATLRRVEKLLKRAPVIDGHNDLPWELRSSHGSHVEHVALHEDTSAIEHPLQTDIPRLRKGRVGGQFWSVYIPARMTGPVAVEATIEQIDIVRRMLRRYPNDFEIATTAADVRRISKQGKVASLIGVEGGHQIDGRLSVLRQYRELGVGYMTLTHGKSVGWADSSTDAPQANGLTDFGRKVVAEMNRIGMIVDISHVSDATMAAVLDVTKAPVIASHSSARALADRPRNVPDALLERIRDNGGVVMVAFYPAFLSVEWNDWDNRRTAYARANSLPSNLYGRETPPQLKQWEAENPEPLVGVKQVADHVEHIVKIAGHDHVGLGGDYDGISGSAPVGMTGVDSYPLLFAELVRRGWSDANLAKLAQGNVLRVMEQVEAVAKSQAGAPLIDATDAGSVRD